MTAPGAGDDLATGLTTPWGLDVLDDGSLLVTERDTGRILLISADGAARQIGTLEPEAQGEGGLLGITLNPAGDAAFAYVTVGNQNRVVRMPWDGEQLGDPAIVLDGIPAAQIHNGGQVRFGPDDYLYVTTGDARERGDSQNPSSLGGKILRITETGDPAPGNPFGNAVYSLGHRNVQGIAWDGAGRLWASEFGQNTWDELNLIEAGGNYGWPHAEGVGGGDGMIDPVHVWEPAEASPSGLAYWRGSLWMAGLRGRTLWQIPIGPDGAGEPVPHWTGEHGRLRTAWTAGDDAPLYVATSNADGGGQPREEDDRILVVQ